ncbi:Biotin--acetyl-CoA-carboxylase ligase [Carpediemonas membranifera]|uniref:Biotin--acetyl-CoA-carboxylase ligase n=1 Tax=Carpediemonas membranifera TaxID=201153 RepID=A0A8J6AR99_9EUKA|nr:Biotin--acetyl-CoA-carboxylase ligase [Carpediemonas membranifera]|eukprot:KAG9392281.1 Biotin--acetyl-CoA-carboxylase ligase [Carpediemonas membranifera]
MNAGDILEPKIQSLEGFGPIYTFDTIDSTQIFTRQYAAELPCPCAVTARQQTRGHGRKNRAWRSPLGCLCFSQLARVTPQVKDVLFCLSPMICVSIVKYLRTLPNSGDISVKWPNDIYVNRQKLCGLLADAISCGNELMVVVGVGINVSNRDDPPGSACLESVLGTKINMAELLATLVKLIDDLLRAPMSVEDLVAQNSDLMCESFFTLPNDETMYRVVKLTRDGGVVTQVGHVGRDKLHDAEWHFDDEA